MLLCLVKNWKKLLCLRTEFYTIATSAFNVSFTCWLHWDKKIISRKKKIWRIFLKVYKRLWNFIGTGFQESMCYLVPALFYRILWRKGSSEQKSGGNCLCLRKLCRNAAAMNIQCSVLGMKWFCIVIFLILLKSRQICLYSRDCIILWQLLNSGAGGGWCFLRCYLIPKTFLNARFKLVYHQGMDPEVSHTETFKHLLSTLEDNFQLKSCPVCIFS